VYTKGSEVGYSLRTVEKILVLKPELKQTFLEQNERQKIQQTKEQIKAEKHEVLPPKLRRENKKSNINSTREIKPQIKEERHFVEQPTLLEQLTRSEHNNERIDPKLLKKKKRKRHHLHL
jgi:hypothetical protein